jgi:hypothetical protein
VQWCSSWWFLSWPEQTAGRHPTAQKPECIKCSSLLPKTTEREARRRAQSLGLMCVYGVHILELWGKLNTNKCQQGPSISKHSLRRQLVDASKTPS